MRILAVIPAFNEEECILDTVFGLKKACPDIDFLIINDGSTDSTKVICEENDFPFVTLPINTGLASGFRTGMKFADRHGYDAVVQFDADGQHFPQFIPLMARKMIDYNADIVIGSRYLDGEIPTGLRGLGSKLISTLIKITTGITITDPTSGMRMFNHSMIRQFAVDFDISPEPDTIALMARREKTIIETPVIMQERQGGESYFDFSHIIGYMTRMCASIVLFQWFK